MGKVCAVYRHVHVHVGGCVCACTRMAKVCLMPVNVRLFLVSFLVDARLNTLPAHARANPRTRRVCVLCVCSLLASAPHESTHANPFTQSIIQGDKPGIG